MGSKTQQRFYDTNLLYTRFRVLKLEDMIKMEFAKFIFKYSNDMLPKSFDNYFTKIENVHYHNTRQKYRNEYFQPSAETEAGKKTLQYIGINIWKTIPEDFRHCSFTKFKNIAKIIF